MSTSKIRPLDDRLLVRREEPEGRTKSGILLPDSAKEKPQRGTVERVGPGAWNREGTARTPVQCEVGDTVLFSTYAGHEIKETDEENLLIMRECDVLAVVG